MIFRYNRRICLFLLLVCVASDFKSVRRILFDDAQYKYIEAIFLLIYMLSECVLCCDVMLLTAQCLRLPNAGAHINRFT